MNTPRMRKRASDNLLFNMMSGTFLVGETTIAILYTGRTVYYNFFIVFSWPRLIHELFLPYVTSLNLSGILTVMTRNYESHF
jgi:hypothetical protein